MNLSEKKYSSLDEYLGDDATAHIDVEEIECIAYDDENTGNVSELTTYLHGSVRKFLQELDCRINSVDVNKTQIITA